MRVYFHTFGCKANQYDTERMRQEAEARGAVAVDAWGEADVCVVNTCTVTNQADADARRFVRRVARENPAARVVVAGCSAALRAHDYRRMDAVETVVPGHDPVSVAEAVGGPTLVSLGLRRPLDRIDTEPIGGELLRRRAGASRGWLKVQDGCDRRCAFCATRLARGASRSRAPEEIVAEARILARTHPELVVTGIHIGHYGRDLDPRWTLARLVGLLLDRIPEVRFRLGSVEATEVDDDLLELLATSAGRLAPHLHMPLQSGADPVLRRMRRWHTRAQYRARALRIAERLDPLGLGADIITGFPGEREEDHRRTVRLVEELPFTYLHVFPFSPRDGTLAADLAGPVAQRVAGERSRELRMLAEEKGRAYRGARLGGRAVVVVEGRGGTALTGDYLRVEARGGPRGDGGLLAGTLRGDGDHLYIAWPRQPPSFSA
ncbi:MAG TPA: MiaB/RimO family radical SAM methylthiotransferase [Longimicrobiales bacterium]|nr:MiaB/RimO family radical SAM methylthiotransferase [Longimicrobiales bacterium]